MNRRGFFRSVTGWVLGIMGYGTAAKAVEPDQAKMTLEELLKSIDFCIRQGANGPCHGDLILYGVPTDDALGAILSQHHVTHLKEWVGTELIIRVRGVAKLPQTSKERLALLDIPYLD